MATLRLVPASGTAIEITKDVLVGRDPTCDVVINDGSVSRKHAKIELRGDSWAVADQASANGTFIDSQRVADAGLRAGQELRFGAVTFKVEIEGVQAADVTMAAAAPSETVIQSAPLVAPPVSKAPPPPPPAHEAKPTTQIPVAPPSAPPPPRPASPPPPPPAARQATGETARPSPVPPMGVPPPPAKKGKSPIFWFGLGCCGCLMVVLLGVAVFFGSIFLGTKGAVDAAKLQISEMKQGQFDRAYGMCSQSMRSEMSAEEFQAAMSAHPGLANNSDVTFFSRSVKNDSGHLVGILTAGSGEREPVIIDLVKEGGDWKVSKIQFGTESSSE